MQDDDLAQQVKRWIQTQKTPDARQLQLAGRSRNMHAWSALCLLPNGNIVVVQLGANNRIVTIKEANLYIKHLRVPAEFKRVEIAYAVGAQVLWAAAVQTAAHHNSPVACAIFGADPVAKEDVLVVLQYVSAAPPGLALRNIKEAAQLVGG